MAPRREGHKAAVMRRLAAAARRRVGKAGAEHAQRFVRHYYADVAPEDLQQESEENLVGAALSAWSFLQTRPRGRPKLRVFNPSVREHGFVSAHTVVEIVNDDMPFLVDSVAGEINRQGLTVHIIIHPTLRTRRSRAGKLTGLVAKGEQADGGAVESVMHIEIDQQTVPDTLRRIRTDLVRVLGDVRAAVNDWRVMRKRITETFVELESARLPLEPAELEEAKAFLHWIEDDHFTFLGYREYAITSKGTQRISVVPGTGLGILRKSSFTVFDDRGDSAELSAEMADFVRKPILLMLGKANRRSPVHRPVHLDTIGVKRFNRAGRVVGERLFIGLFTSEVYNQSVRGIPLIRRKVDNIVARSGFTPRSHAAKALLNALETLPRDELLQIGEDDLLATGLGMLQLEERQRIKLFVHPDPYGRYVSCLVFVPRDRYDTELREAMQQIVADGFGGPVTAYYTQLTDAPLARLHFIVKTVPGVAAPQSVAEIEERLVQAGREWSDDLRRYLVQRHGEERGLILHRSQGEAFPPAYREQFDAIDAVSDVARIEAALETDKIGMHLYRARDASEDEIRFKLYHRNTPLPLSDVLPMLENMGLKVIDEVPHRIVPRDAGDEVWIHDFGLVTRSGAPVDVEKVKELFEDAFARVWSGETQNDGFNKLILGAGLAWRQVVILRAYCKFLLQATIPFSQAYMEETLAGNPAVTRMIIDLFESLFDPAAQDGAVNARSDRLRRRIDQALEAVAVLDEDRILRRFVNVVESTLRTNYYQRGPDAAPKPYLSFKLDSLAIDDLPLPRPMVEIFVHSPRVDAVHLRGGRVARGGIRWSDRREDFRTEILGLMKAQMTKNAVIVPVGAKGGFVVKRPPPPGDRAALLAEGVACYQTMMRGLLDITDNLKSGRIEAPENVVRRDGDDPYLVVAADKGTATFSDIANEIAAEYGFWLHDAFASGGSVGYDHKVMGITARGVWESVKRHFREMDVDIQRTDFTCIGIGDMAGDVFGNGMLCSRHTRLVGAFNHLHVFIDPNPDAEVSYRERRRLFRMSRSSWSDYDRKLISKGGGIFERSAKSIKVTPEMCAAFDFSAKPTVTPNELVRAMLKAPVDLLWFGGIGTFIKARRETSAEADDRANDVIRVDAAELRCKVVGEGANLGATQRGRIEYALAGGRINTDFIDNSAGVDCSDHEVNIKIVLGEAVGKGKLSMLQRNKLLVKMTDEVAELVLMDNYRQSMALTHAENQSIAMLDEHVRFMRALEQAGELNRNVEFLPDDDGIDERRADGLGLARPELAVLLTYAKNSLFRELLEGDVPDDPHLTNDLGLYFPKAMRRRFAKFISGHRLRREITATYVTNTIVNRTGPSFVNDVKERTGATASEIARAYLICRRVFHMAELWTGVEALDNSVPAEIQTAMHLKVLQLIKRGTLWFLRSGLRPLAIDRTVAAFEPGVTALRAGFARVLSAELKSEVDGLAENYAQNRAPADLAAAVAGLDALAPACDIVRIAAAGQFAPTAVARVYYGLGVRFGFDWLRAAANTLFDGGEWQRMAALAIFDDLYTHQTQLANRVLDDAGGTEVVDAVIDAWAAAHEAAVERVHSIVADLRLASTVDLAMLAVANREIRTLISA